MTLDEGGLFDAFVSTIFGNANNEEDGGGDDIGIDEDVAEMQMGMEEPSKCGVTRLSHRPSRIVIRFDVREKSVYIQMTCLSSTTVADEDKLKGGSLFGHV